MTAKTIEQIMEEERKAREDWESRETFKGFTIAHLRKVMDAVQNPEHWKLEWAAKVHHSMVTAIFAAVEFFHADRPTVHGVEPITGLILMSGRGYQAD